MSTLSTHALDTASGKPAQGLPLVLEKQGASGTDWQVLAQGVTNADGRCPDLFAEGENALEPGIYRMGFDTGHYFAQHKIVGFYPRVEVMFEIHAANEHYHVPLLISPFGFSTYRGS